MESRVSKENKFTFLNEENANRRCGGILSRVE
jgi:hypothetical protein